MNLEKNGTNVGSLCRIELAAIDTVIDDADVVMGVVEAEPTFVPSTGWDEVYFTQDSAHFVERHDGDKHELKVVWRAPKDSAASLRFLEEVKKKRYLARITDLNETVKIAGTKEEPCAVKHVMRDHGQNARDSNHYNMELTLTRHEPAAIVVG